MSNQSHHEAGTQATLASTGEKVRILYRVQDSHTGTIRYRCILPPQAPGHRPRIQTIAGKRLG